MIKYFICLIFIFVLLGCEQPGQPTVAEVFNNFAHGRRYCGKVTTIRYINTTNYDPTGDYYSTIKYIPALHRVDPLRQIHRNIDPVYRLYDYGYNSNND